MEKNLIKAEKTSKSKILSLVFAVFFLIGSVYYSYIHIETALYKMHTLTSTKLPDGKTEFGWEFRFSNINAASVLGVLFALVMCAMTVALLVLAFKDKFHILTAFFSTVIINIQLLLPKMATGLEEYKFAKYVLRLGKLSYDIGFHVKFVPFAIAFVLSVVCFVLVMLSRKSTPAEA